MRLQLLAGMIVIRRTFLMLNQQNTVHGSLRTVMDHSLVTTDICMCPMKMLRLRNSWHLRW